MALAAEGINSMAQLPKVEGKIPLDQVEEILTVYKALRTQGLGKTQACREIADIYNRHWTTILGIVARLHGTTNIADVILKRGAARMASRVVRKANVTESIDVLERIGVLAPKQSGEGAGQSGFFLSVSMDTCGAVKVGAGQLQGWQPNALGPAAEQAIDVEAIKREQAEIAAGPDEPAGRPTFMGRNKAYQEAVARHKAALAQKRAALEAKKTDEEVWEERRQKLLKEDEVA